MAVIMKTLRITPHGVTKISPFEAHLGRKPNTPLSNLATTSSANNPIRENAKHACLDRRNITKPPLPDETMHGLQQWSEDEVSIKNDNNYNHNQWELTRHLNKHQVRNVKKHR